MALDSRSLHTFLTVCRAGSMSAAAKMLHISQPAVSVVIARLERTLHTRLITRARSGVVLTPSGKALQRRATALEQLLRTAEREVALIEGDVAGPLLIGGTPGVLASLVPRALNTLRRRYPRLDLQILERTERELSEMLRVGEIELALVTTGLGTVAADLLEERLVQDSFNLIVGQAHARLPSRLQLKEVSTLGWVLPHADGAFRRQIDALFIGAELPLPDHAIRCDSLLTTKAIVRQSEYVTILPRLVAAAELSMGVLRAIELEEATFARHIGVRTLAAKHLSTLAQAFIDALRHSDVI